MIIGNVTISEAWLWLLAACAAVAAIAKAWDIIRNLWRKGTMADELKKTNAKVEEDSRHFAELLDADNKRIKELEQDSKELKQANAVIMQALLALVNHGIDGNNIEGLKETRSSLSKYLINRQ